jgi:hypothetical protein
MEELIAKKNALEEQQEKINEESSRIYRELEEITKEIRHIEINDMSEDYKTFLVKRLTLLKAYIDVARDVNNYLDVGYKIKKMKSPRQNDYHEDEPDYLPWVIHDDECLAMHYYIDVIIEIYSPAVEEFVVDWITKNIPKMENHLFGSYN